MLQGSTTKLDTISIECRSKKVVEYMPNRANGKTLKVIMRRKLNLFRHIISRKNTRNVINSLRAILNGLAFL
jgi:hypothetical protein